MEPHTPCDSALPSTYLAFIKDRCNLRLFSPDSESWTTSIPLSSPIEARNSSLISLPNGLLLCIGGYDSQYNAFLHDVFEIQLETGHVRLLDLLSQPRCGIGLVFIGDFVYGFGGRNVKVQKTCEKLSLTTGRWTQLPEMRAGRAYFNPVVVNEDVYLCGGLVSLSEVFNLLTETYKTLDFVLPEATECIVSIREGEALVIASRTITRWRVGEQTLPISDELKCNGCKTTMPPVIFQEKIYIVSDGEVWKIDVSVPSAVMLISI